MWNHSICINVSHKCGMCSHVVYVSQIAVAWRDDSKRYHNYRTVTSHKTHLTIRISTSQWQPFVFTPRNQFVHKLTQFSQRSSEEANRSRFSTILTIENDVEPESRKTITYLDLLLLLMHRNAHCWKHKYTNRKIEAKQEWFNAKYWMKSSASEERTTWATRVDGDEFFSGFWR